MALPRRRVHRDTSIGPDQLHIPRRPPASYFSTTQRTWYGKAASQGPQQQVSYRHLQQLLNSTGKPESTGFKFTENKCDARGSIQQQNQQQHIGPGNIEARFNGGPEPIITAGTNTRWASLAECGPGNQSSPFFLATIPPKSQGRSDSTILTVAESLMRPNLERITPVGPFYPALETTDVQHYIPRLQAQKHALKDCHNNWEEDKRARSMHVEDRFHQQGDIQPGWSDPMNRMACMTISSTSDTNFESTYPATTEWLEQTGNRGYVPDFTKESSPWQGAQNFIQQPQRWSDDLNNDYSRPFVTQTSLSIPQDDWNELHTTPLGYQCSPDSSLSSCFTPDTLHEPVNFDSPGFHDMNAPMGYFDQNPRREKLPEWHDDLFGVEPFEPNTTTPGRPRKTKACEPQSPPNIGPQRTSAKDEYLIRCKSAGMSYKEIKEKGNFSEAESTLRGRFRTLTKRKEQRVRKPGWQEKDVRLLCEAVRKYANPTQDIAGEDITSSKISWKQVGEYIWKNGGSYHFGNATCKKKWAQIQQDVIILRPEDQFS
ncbi:hypothetical protein EMCG_00338 [[Emmonsia] crescens]|uniref:Myb-like domain-containing protein n=1 Tax=[Emmonsia] crescens TaxID=73230 RepID=A0A0G2HXX4_9EURO|nr:hypothetical protein EMCG_00338 [Emmonsia crescens UAMH 3008]